MRSCPRPSDGKLRYWSKNKIGGKNGKERDY